MSTKIDVAGIFERAGAARARDRGDALVNREALIDAAIMAVRNEIRVLNRDHDCTFDAESLRYALEREHLYRDALDQIERDYEIDVSLPMDVMAIYHAMPALKEDA